MKVATLKPMKNKFTAVIKKDAGWWIGWIEEIPGVNSQGKTRAELMKNLRSALGESTMKHSLVFELKYDLCR